MVEGPPIALRCRNTGGRTLAVSPQQERQADDHPPVEPPVSPGGQGGRDQEGRDAARVAPQLRDPPARAWYRYKNDPGAARSRQIGDNGALHACRHRHDRRRRKPARPVVTTAHEAQEEPERPAAGVAACGGARPALEVADIFRDHGAAWRRTNARHVSLDQLKVMSAIERCRTVALGGHVARCEDCADTVIAYNSCRNRHCPKCQGAAAKEWLAEREAELLPVGYFHLVFTLPGPIADL